MPANRRQQLAVTIFGIAAFYGLAINPYFIPQTYDDVLYFEGARALLSTGQYTYAGAPIVDWPPAMSAMLAALFTVLGENLIWGKWMIFASVLVATFLTARLFEREGRPAPLLIVAAWCILPASYLAGAR